VVYAVKYISDSAKGLVVTQRRAILWGPFFQNELELVFFALFDIDLHQIHLGVEVAGALEARMVLGMGRANADAMAAHDGAVVGSIRRNGKRAIFFRDGKPLFAHQGLLSRLQRLEKNHHERHRLTFANYSARRFCRGEVVFSAAAG
jgi:hypothetical protein